MTPAWPKAFDRAEVRYWIEDVIQTGLSVEDSFPDTLIATAQSLGLTPITLKLWIYDQPKTGGWNIQALGVWARRMGFLTEEEQT
jgi:hypothetical protein